MVTIGVDEVGRGSWAGPVVAGAVVLDTHIAGLKDSKLLSKKQRDSLDKEIRNKSTAFAIGWSSVDVINEHGLSYAISEAMNMAVSQIPGYYDEIIIDGNFNFLPKLKGVKVIPKADNLFEAVSAASIIAKVYRDNLMAQLANKYPEYGFDKHVGYGTKMHLDQLKKFGPCTIHRLGFKPIKSLLSAA